MLNLISKEIIGLLLKYSKKEPDKDDKEIFIYGLECFLNTSIVVIILILWGILVHQFFETILWIIVFALTRHYSGGLHAPSEFSCIFISVCLGITNHFFITHFNRRL